MRGKRCQAEDVQSNGVKMGTTESGLRLPSVDIDTGRKMVAGGNLAI
jgi:hypothetical protein